MPDKGSRARSTSASLPGCRSSSSKLQEWVHARGLRVVVLFEGRDAAGKGGAIKTITSRLNPRDRAGRRPPGANRARTHAVVFPALRGRTCPRPARWSCSTAAGTTAPASSASWASATADEYRGVLPLVPRVRADAGALRDHPDQVLVLGQRRRAGAAVPGPHPGPDEALEAVSPMDLQSRARWVEYSSAKDEMFRAHRHQAGALVRRATPTTSGGPGSTSSTTCFADPYEDLTPDPDRPAAARAGCGYVRPPIDEQTFVPDRY